MCQKNEDLPAREPRGQISTARRGMFNPNISRTARLTSHIKTDLALPLQYQTKARSSRKSP